MNKIEQYIVDIMKALYNINEQQEKSLINSFSKTSEKDKSDILKILIESFKQIEYSMSIVNKKVKKIYIEIDELEENFKAEKIIDNFIN